MTTENAPEGTSAQDAALVALGALGDPVRRGLYRLVAASPVALGRDAAAEAAGVSRSLAAFHLDKLVDAGLLVVSFQRISGRSGPGAGRPAKLYCRAPGEHSVTVPPRSYGAVGRLLAEVVDRAGLEHQLQAAARAAGAGEAAGEAAGERAGDPIARLGARGYQPFLDGADTVRLNNCPFHALAEEFPALVCGMNLALIEGLLERDEDWSAVMRPTREGCCVALISKTNNS